MSCKNTCSCRAVKSIKFDELPCTAHVVSHDDLDYPFAVVMVDGVAYMELAICPAAGSEFTALFEIYEDDDGYGVVVPDYVADLNEKLLNDLDIIPIIADDPEFEDEDENENENENEDDQEVSGDSLSDIDGLAELDAKAKNMLVAALRTPTGKELFRRFVSATNQEEELHWLTQMLDFVTYLDSQNAEQSGEKCADKKEVNNTTSAKAGKLVEYLISSLFSEDKEECKKSDSSEAKHSCKGCGKCKSESGKVGALGADMAGMREDKETDTKVTVPVDLPANKLCATGVRWNEEEDNELMKLGAAVGCFGISWDDVAAKLGRTPDACRKRFHKIKGIQK